jgi:hypothetical protein
LELETGPHFALIVPADNDPLSLARLYLIAILSPDNETYSIAGIVRRYFTLRANVAALMCCPEMVLFEASPVGLLGKRSFNVSDRRGNGDFGQTAVSGHLIA